MFSSTVTQNVEYEMMKIRKELDAMSPKAMAELPEKRLCEFYVLTSGMQHYQMRIEQALKRQLTRGAARLALISAVISGVTVAVVTSFLPRQSADWEARSRLAAVESRVSAIQRVNPTPPPDLPNPAAATPVTPTHEIEGPPFQSLVVTPDANTLPVPSIPTAKEP